MTGLASDKQLKFVNSIRVAMADYDAVIGGPEPHDVLSPEDTWDLTKAAASAYIGKYKDEAAKCTAALLDAREQ